MLLKRSVLLPALACLACCTSFGGETEFDPDSQPPRRPSWADGLIEHVAPVPAEDRPPSAGVATPTQWPEDKGRGRPADLAAKQAEASLDPLPGPPPLPRPAAAGGRGGAGRGAAGGVGDVTQTVTVNVGDETEEASEEPAADPTSVLEKMYAGNLEQTPNRSLLQFGYTFFDREVDDEMFGPVGPDHIIVPGDELVVVLSNTVQGAYERIVARDGTIEIPEAGNIPVAGIRYADLQQHLERSYANRARRVNFRLEVTVGRLRGFRVHVVGQVETPGILEVPGRANVLTAIASAGGVLKTGSLRKVELRREGASIATIDLYRFLLSGDTSGLVALEPDDVIHVPNVGETIAVAGSVQRPGIYETLGQLDVGAAIELAGGLTPFTFKPNAQLERTVEGRGRTRTDIALDEAGRAETMGDGEMLLIGSIGADPETMVEVTGEVGRPGAFQFRDGMTVRDLIQLADGLTVEAFMPQAILSRQVGEAGSVTLVPGRQAFDTTRRVLVIDLRKALNGDAEHDLELRPLDLLRVVRHADAAEVPVVEVIGAVRNPGRYELTAGLTVSQLVAIAGNVVPEVYWDEAELIRRTYDEVETVLRPRRYRIDLRKALELGGEHDPVLANHDQLVIRQLKDLTVKVKVEGQVRFPGTYPFPKGARITDLIAAAGGLLGDADMRGAVFLRESVRDVQQTRFVHLKEYTRAIYERVYEEMLASGWPPEALSAKVALRQTKELIDRMDNFQSNGRVVVPFLRDDFPKSDVDLLLEEGDYLLIPAQQQTVSVVGHVFNPSAYVAESGVTVADLIARSGGIHEHGDEGRVYVIRADGTVQSVEQKHFTLKQTSTLFPGDVVMVPRAPLERSLGNQFSDLLYYARRSVEIALLSNGFVNGVSPDFTSLMREDPLPRVITNDRLSDR